MKIPSDLNISRVEQSELQDQGCKLGWEAVAYLDQDQTPIGSGYALEKQTAIQIAVAESIERHLVMQMLARKEASEIARFGLDINPSSSGFAFATSDHTAARRALAEGFEHFVRYHGIYRGLKLEPETASAPQSKLTNFLDAQFDKVRLWRRTQTVHIQSHRIDLSCVIALGFKESGVFLGARAGTLDDELVEHSLLEAWRNLRIFRHEEKAKTENLNPVRQRNLFFAQNGALGESQVNSSAEPWSEAQVDLYEIIHCDSADGHLARAIFRKSPPWHNLEGRRLI